MTQRDAQIFGDICDFIIDGFVYYPKKYQRNHPILSFGNVVHLQNIGLVYSASYLKRNMKFSPDIKQLFYVYQDIVLSIATSDDSRDVGVPVILVTGPGAELHRIMESTVRMDYLQSFSNFLKGENCDLSYARILEKYHDGSFRRTNLFIPIEPKSEQFGGAAP